MKNTSATTDSHVESPLQTEEALSQAQVIAWSCTLTWEAAFITLGNLLTIVIFAFTKKIRVKKSLYLVINMAFADLALGSVCLPISVHCDSTPVDDRKICVFSQNHYCSFCASLIYYRCFDIC